MRLLLHDTLATLPFTLAFAEGWVAPPDGLSVELRPELPGGALGPDVAALLPTPEAALLVGSHAVVPTVACLTDSNGAVSLRTPVRPDEVERTPVRLAGVSSAAELLARGTLRAFYGIEPAHWDRGEGAEAQAVVLEGAEALRPAEAGFAEDLSRAWFILTGLPFVSHLLVVPDGDGAGTADVGPVVTLLGAARAAAHERRRTWRQPWVERQGIPRERFDEVLNGQRHALDPDDRRALTALLSHGGRGTPYPTSPAWRFAE
jgi:hypothetical protein